MQNNMDWKELLLVAGLTSVAAPVTVLVHELAHIIAFTLAGIPSHLVAFGMAMPVGYQWNVESLRQAQMHYGAGTGALVLWAVAFSAIGLRMIGVLSNAPRIIRGTLNTSDEVICAFFLGWPVWTVYVPSLAVGLASITLFIASLPKRDRVLTSLTGILCSIAGYLAVEYLFNIYVFHLEIWTR